MGNDHLTEIHLIEIVIFQLIKSFNNESFIFYHLTEFFETFQLIESSNNGILSFKKISINCQKPSVLFCQLIETFINVILGYFKISINWLNPSVLIWQLIELIFNFLAAVCRYLWQTNFECKVSKEKENRSNHSFCLYILFSKIVFVNVKIF